MKCANVAFSFVPRIGAGDAEDLVDLIKSGSYIGEKSMHLKTGLLSYY